MRKYISYSDDLLSYVSLPDGGQENINIACFIALAWIM